MKRKREREISISGETTEDEEEAVVKKEQEEDQDVIEHLDQCDAVDRVFMSRVCGKENLLNLERREELRELFNSTMKKQRKFLIEGEKLFRFYLNFTFDDDYYRETPWYNQTLSSSTRVLEIIMEDANLEPVPKELFFLSIGFLRTVDENGIRVALQDLTDHLLELLPRMFKEAEAQRYSFMDRITIMETKRLNDLIHRGNRLPPDLKTYLSSVLDEMSNNSLCGFSLPDDRGSDENIFVEFGQTADLIKQSLVSKLILSQHCEVKSQPFKIEKFRLFRAKEEENHNRPAPKLEVKAEESQKKIFKLKTENCVSRVIELERHFGKKVQFFFENTNPVGVPPNWAGKLVFGGEDWVEVSSAPNKKSCKKKLCDVFLESVSEHWTL
eukprot:augustus_masked-scaffold_8-processed-gene-5.60-mRNA-1 protein AED:0.19 eAED:1.00 QI:0/-1/0/1/-1/1/1/0/383